MRTALKAVDEKKEEIFEENLTSLIVSASLCEIYWRSCLMYVDRSCSKYYHKVNNYSQVSHYTPIYGKYKSHTCATSTASIRSHRPHNLQNSIGMTLLHPVSSTSRAMYIHWAA